MATLNVNDLAMVVKIIDLGSEKGIFKGADLKPVGDLRERIVEFVKQVEATKEQPNESTSTEAE
jgi:hypothetical protein